MVWSMRQVSLLVLLYRGKVKLASRVGGDGSARSTRQPASPTTIIEQRQLFCYDIYISGKQ
jgi:hypothetical protein